MQFTYDLNENGCLILRADAIEREQLRELANEDGEFSSDAEHEALEKLIANSELEWIAPEEIGALTDAPILGLRDEDYKPTSAWAFMDYQVRSFLSDLVACGEAVFIS